MSSSPFTHAIWQKPEFRDRPSDYEHAVFCKLSYSDDKTHQVALDTLLNGGGWSYLCSSQASKSDGYQGFAYVNRQHKWVVICHKGTAVTSLGALAADAEGIVHKQITSQQASAAKFATEIRERPDLSEYSAYITGHSLGAWLAELTTYYFQCVYEEKHDSKWHTSATVFDSPGSLEMLEQIQPRIGGAIDLAKLDITSYLAPPNLVNTCNTHIGLVFRVFPKLPPGWIDKLPTHPVTHLAPYTFLGTHSMDGLFDTFDPLTGRPTNFLHVLDWPCIDWPSKGTSPTGVIPNLPPVVGGIIDRVTGAVTKVREVSSLARVIADVVAGKVDSKEYEAFFKFARNANLYDPKPHDLTFHDSYSLAHQAHYKAVEYDSHLLRLSQCTPNVAHFLRTYAKGKRKELPSVQKLIETLPRADRARLERATLTNDKLGIHLRSGEKSFEFRAFITQLLATYPNLLSQLEQTLTDKMENELTPQLSLLHMSPTTLSERIQHVFEDLEIDLSFEILWPFIRQYPQVSGGIDNELIFLMGDTKVGKSTGIHYLMGHEMVRKREGARFIATTTSTAGPHTSASINSTTVTAAVWKTKVGHWCDCAGFHHSGPPEEQLWAPISSEIALTLAQGVKLAIAIQHHDITMTTADGTFSELLAVLAELFKNSLDLSLLNIDNTPLTDGTINKPRCPFLFIITQVPRDIIEDMTEEELKEEWLNRIEKLANNRHELVLELLDRFRTTKNPEDEQRALKALGQFRIFDLIRNNPDQIVCLNIFDKGESREKIKAQLNQSVPLDQKAFNFSWTRPQRSQFDQVIGAMSRAINEVIKERLENFACAQENAKKLLEFFNAKARLEEELRDFSTTASTGEKEAYLAKIQKDSRERSSSEIESKQRKINNLKAEIELNSYKLESLLSDNSLVRIFQDTHDLSGPGIGYLTVGKIARLGTQIGAGTAISAGGIGAAGLLGGQIMGAVALTAATGGGFLAVLGAAAIGTVVVGASTGLSLPHLIAKSSSAIGKGADAVGEVVPEAIKDAYESMGLATTAEHTFKYSGRSYAIYEEFPAHVKFYGTTRIASEADRSAGRFETTAAVGFYDQEQVGVELKQYRNCLPEVKQQIKDLENSIEAAQSSIRVLQEEIKEIEKKQKETEAASVQEAITGIRKQLLEAQRNIQQLWPYLQARIHRLQQYSDIIGSSDFKEIMDVLLQMKHFYRKSHELYYKKGDDDEAFKTLETLVKEEEMRPLQKLSSHIAQLKRLLSSENFDMKLVPLVTSMIEFKY